MRIVKQGTSLPIENEDFEGNLRFKKHRKLFPPTIRCIIVSPSNCEKTNEIFENVYFYSKSLGQPKYSYLEKLLKPMKDIKYYAFSTSENILHPSEAKRNSLFIFDDVDCDNQEIIREYFSIGRHNHIDSFYLIQTYAKITKHLIKDNANMLVLFKNDDLNLKHVYKDHVGTDMSFDNFKSICSICWNAPYEFLCISKDSNINDGRYRKGFDHYIYLE